MAKNESSNLTSHLKLRTFITCCAEHDTLLRSIKTVPVIGTKLAVLNHGQDLLARPSSLSWLIRMRLTYLVPFVVATYGQVQGKRQRNRARTGAEAPST